MERGRRSFVIKAEVAALDAAHFVFLAHKTMYAGKTIAPGDQIYVFSSENSGGSGLIARGTVTSAQAVPAIPGLRLTPRVSITAAREATAVRPLGRSELRGFRGGPDDAPETELDFKLYRQATDKIVGVSDTAAAFLDSRF